MKIRICLKREGLVDVVYDTDMKDDQIKNFETADLLFADMAKSDMARGYVLKRWVLRQVGRKYKGSATEKSPRLRNGDHVTLWAVKVDA